MLYHNETMHVIFKPDFISYTSFLILNRAIFIFSLFLVIMDVNINSWFLIYFRRSQL